MSANHCPKKRKTCLIVTKNILYTDYAYKNVLNFELPSKTYWYLHGGLALQKNILPLYNWNFFPSIATGHNEPLINSYHKNYVEWEQI